MLIQQVVGTLRTPFIQSAFGFGSAESRPIGLRLLLRLMPFDALLEPLQIDYFSHACPIEQPRKPARSSFKQSSPSPSDSIKKSVRLAKTKSSMLYHGPAHRR
jgi:hypothetical protein